VQCEVLSQLLQYPGMKRLSAPQLRRLVEEATEAAPASGLFERQAGPGRVHSPSAIVGPARRVVWWAFRRDQAPQVRPLPWTRAESEALAAGGVHLPDPATEAIENARAWRRPLLMASSSLVMVCPRLGEDGEEIYPHPLWDELVAGRDPRAASSKLARSSAPHFPELARQPRTRLALPRVVETWSARKGSIVPRVESPTSLGTLVGCPLKWVLEHTGRVRSGAAASLPVNEQLWGRLAHEIIARIPRSQLPADPQRIARVVLAREQTMPTYLGKGLAVPHGRFEGLDRPMLAFARSDQGVPVEGSNERAELFFMLLTPSGMARIQPRLLADIVDLFDSEYVVERLRKAETPEEVFEAICAGLDVAID